MMCRPTADERFAFIETARLIIRRFAASDDAPFFAYRSDPRVSRYKGWKPESIGEVEEFIDRMSRLHPNMPGTWFQLAVCRKDSGELIGDCGLRFPDGDDSQVEIGYTVAPAHQGHGYATESVTAVLDYLFGSLGKRRAYGSVEPANTRSIALLERIGMRRQAHFRDSVPPDGEWGDDVIYAILDEEWNRNGRSVVHHGQQPGFGGSRTIRTLHRPV